jgi:hypothetical protein
MYMANELKTIYECTQKQINKIKNCSKFLISSIPWNIIGFVAIITTWSSCFGSISIIPDFGKEKSKNDQLNPDKIPHL